MNRQTIAVALGTLAVVLIGGFLLYSTPNPDRPRPVPSGDGPAKAKRVEDEGPKRLGEGRLTHASDIEADRVAAPKDAPNVVVVFVSTQRRDQWSAYGGPAEVTPFLAAQSKTGVRMMDALSVTVDPRTAGGTLITGRYPHALGLVEPGDKKNFRDLPLEADTIAERMQRAGWFTVGATANHHLNVKAGAGQGFDWYRDAQPFSLMIDQRMDGSEVVDRTLARLGRRNEAEKARPVYLQVALIDSHKPFKVTPEEYKPFEKPDDPCDCAPYRATVNRVDRAIEALVAGLAAQGLTNENTVFSVIADHGEGLGLPPAHRKQHGFVLYRSAVQIPWLVWGKGIPAGKDLTSLVSQLDFAPTVLGLAGLTEQAGMDGLDLAPVVRTGEGATRDLAYADTMFEGAHRASVWTSTAECQADYGSVIEEPDTFATACYDRTTDADFTKPVDNAELAAKLQTMHTDLLGKAVAAAASAPAGVEEGKAEKAKGKGKGKGKKGE